MKKIFFFQLIFLCLQTQAQKPKITTPAKAIDRKELPGEINTNTAPSISPIITIPHNGIITPPTATQAKDNLLWYKGKKVNDSILITTDAKLVLYSSKRNMVIVQPPAKKDPSLNILKELANTQKRKDEYYKKMAERKSSVMMYPAIVGTLNEFDMLFKKFEEMLKNFITLLPVPNTAVNYQQHNTGLAKVRFVYTAGVPQYLINAYNKVLADKKNYPSIDFPACPSKELGNCFNCDSSLASQQNKTEQRWKSEFSLYEEQMITRSISIIKTLTDLNLEKEAEALQMITELKQAMEFAWARLDSKVDLLIRKYGNDYTKLSSVIQVAISFERQKQLMGIGDDASYAKTMEKLIPLFNGFEKYIDQQIAARNYDVVLNYSFILGMERQRQLFIGGETDKSGEYVEKINAFNRFKIDMQMDYNSSSEKCGGTLVKDIAHATNNGVDDYLFLGMVNCKYQFFLGESPLANAPTYHFARRYNMGLEIRSGSTMETKNDDEGSCWVIPHNLAGLFISPDGPFVNISFCKDGDPDTLRMTRMHLSKSHGSDKRYAIWQLEKFDERMRNPLPGSNPPPDEFLQELEETGPNSGKFELPKTGNPSKDQMEDHYYKAIHREYLEKKLNEYEEHGKSTAVVFDAKNGDEVIIDERVIKTYQDDDGEATFKVKVKVTHAPLPYKKLDAKKN